jgi:ElaB/YqjD/DUF883 family membrane-anchored ribosome-binding protein
MSTDTFPKSQKDITKLKQTATDATNDLTGAVNNAKSQLSDLAGHIKEDAGDHLNQVKGSIESVALSAKNYVAERPLQCLGVAFVLGVIIGRFRFGSSND